MTHLLPELSFSRNALEPVISGETIDVHHGKHHKGYVDKLNSLIPGTKFEHMTLTEIVRASDGVIFNNAAQAWNHDFYWKSLIPKNTPPRGALLHAIEKKFGDLGQFTSEFNKASAGLFGSGWAWLVADARGNIDIETTSNALNPIKQGKMPLLVVDVWEHAYYLDYRNERGRYLDAIPKILDWEFADRNYSATVLAAAV